MQDTVLIAGAGQAAAQAIISLRQGGYGGRIILAGEEPYLPYQRPPLSKKFLAGGIGVERLQLRPEHFYRDHGIELRLGTRVERIDPARNVARIDGQDLRYDKLILATGSQVRRIPVPGQDLPHVHYLRTIDDVQGIQQDFRAGRRMVVIGGGYIGLEVAAVAAVAGLEVTVVEIAERLMVRTVAAPISSFYLEAHRAAGVRFHLQTGITAIRQDGDALLLDCTTGETLRADVVVVGVGILPAIQLAQEAGLACHDGIVVDEFCRTSDPDIYAAGDCSFHPNELLGRQLRLESVHNATEQGRTAALHILGQATPYAQVPWFWSDQYDLKLQMTGIAEDYTTMVMRGDPASRSFAVFYLRGQQLVAVHAVNSPREFMLSKKLIAGKARLDPARVADAATPFRELAEAACHS